MATVRTDHSPRPRLPFALAAALSGLALASASAVAVAPPAYAGARHSGVVSENPVNWTPHVLDGSVTTIAEAGGLIVAAGDFTEVSDPEGSTTLDRDRIFAFEPGTGEISSDFRPDVNGTITSVVPGPGDTVFIGGRFDRVSGELHRGIALVSTADGEPVDGFSAGIENGSVYRLAVNGGQLYAGGSFTSVDGTERTGVARFDADTGKLDKALDITIAESRRGDLRVEELAVSPDGDRLVIAGNFTKVEGKRRYQIAMIDTGSNPARLSNWSTEEYSKPCDFEHMHTYLRQIDFAPDGSYFAVATAGGPDKKDGLCKTVARWETSGPAGARPTWVNHTGGDAVYSVAVTGAAVYVGGHQRWMDNPHGDHHPGPGSVAREGIGAIDPRTGKALPWNPGRERGHGAEALLATADGLYVGSDTTRLGGEYKGRIGMFPLE
ncbi:hypothetical protein LG943_15645 [Streptomonospora sp. S1-112]|uniref:Uncharacterized protein n=1 Tax=Streptomonospora mangrovi TaxID=2883123 RepID=A0A9X3SPD1_9ACTN|nr:delta-60 repeat domain-containing protein [Streptomonospora mangrovi]MDA0565736.1 hypothetical protein [Streptomonospora mangrovi]